MASGPAKVSGFWALLIALAAGLLLAWTQQAQGPSRSELAQAIGAASGERLRAEALRDLDCTQGARGYACSWRQRGEDGWEDKRGTLVVARQGWRLVESSDAP